MLLKKLKPALSKFSFYTLIFWPLTSALRNLILVIQIIFSILQPNFGNPEFKLGNFIHIFGHIFGLPKFKIGLPKLKIGLPKLKIGLPKFKLINENAKLIYKGTNFVRKLNLDV